MAASEQQVTNFIIYETINFKHQYSGDRMTEQHMNLSFAR
eukprot:SAG31_NODE_2799_length_5080_cov_2.022485_3_plen_40_part_00